MNDIDFFEWDRRALPLPEVHFNTGPLEPAELGDWVMNNINRPPFYLNHPTLWMAHATAVAFVEHLGPGKALLISGNLVP